MAVILTLLSLILALASISYVTAEANKMVNPGKVFIWTNGDASEPSYVTKSMEVKDIAAAIAELSKQYELTVILNPSSQVDAALLKGKMIDSSNLKVFNYVYPSNNQETIAQTLSAAPAVASLASVQELSAHLVPTGELLNNAKPDLIQVEVSNLHVDDGLIKRTICHSLPKEFKSKVLFVSYADVTPSSTNNGRKLLQIGEYSRVLQSSSISSDIAEGKFYKPEGSEYAIYFANTYLYITPDIFTGLMTGIFLVFVIYIGISCLGSIQGMSSFYDKLPVVGREA